MGIAGVADANTVTNANVFSSTSPTPAFTVSVTPRFTAGAPYSTLGGTNPTPTAVYFQIDGGSAAWTPVTNATTSNGVTTFPVTPAALGVGLHTLYAYATYGDDASEASSTGANDAAVLSNTAGLEFNIALPGSSVAVTAPSTAIGSGSTQTYTATLTPGTAAGTVNFTDTYNGTTTPIGTATVSSGIASVSYAAVGNGTHTITATYTGSTAFLSSAGSLAVTAATTAATTTTVGVSATSVPINSAITVSATVGNQTAGGPTPAGTVTFFDTVNGTTSTVGTAALSAGSANTSYTVLTAGTNVFTATFTPTDSTAFSPSSDNTGKTVTVTQLQPAITWSPTTNLIFTGNPLGTGVLDATSNVQGTFTYTATLAGGAAQTVTATTVLAAGAYTLTANFVPANPGTYSNASASIAFTVQNQSVFVTSGGNSVASFFNTGTAQTAPTTGGGTGAAVDSTGSVWSINSAGNGVARFTDVGALQATYTGGGISGATALAIDGLGKVWISNGNGTVTALTNAGGSGVAAPVAAAGNLSTPASLTIDGSGSLWLANSGNNTVTEIIGIAAPVATPTVTQVINLTPGTRP